MSEHDIAGEILAKAVNSQPPEVGGRAIKATYVPHLAKLIVAVGQTQEERRAIFAENRLLYEQHRIKMGRKILRAETAGDCMLRLPEHDLVEIKKRYPEARADAPKEDRQRFYRKLYRNNPEYRTG